MSKELIYFSKQESFF